jgi:hypothetical protein
VESGGQREGGRSGERLDKALDSVREMGEYFGRQLPLAALVRDRMRHKPGRRFGRIGVGKKKPLLHGALLSLT